MIKKKSMTDRILLSVTEILDDDTGIWANDLCEYEISVGYLEEFLNEYGTKGAQEICKMLDSLKKAVMEDYLPKIKKEGSGKMKVKLSKSQWEKIGKKAGWMKTSSSKTDEAFYVLLAGVPKELVVSRYQLQSSDLAEIENMSLAASGLNLVSLIAKVKKEQLPRAYWSLWDKYHKGR